MMNRAENEEGDQAEHRVPALHLVSDEHSNVFMIITLEEKLWALEIKMAVESNEQMVPLTDMEYVQHALIAGGDPKSVLPKILALQEFRRYYGIDNSMEQAIHYLHRLFQLQQGFCLHIGYEEATQEVSRIFDMGAWNPEAALSLANGVDYNWKTTIVGLYYLAWCCHPTFASIRKGILEVIDYGDFEGTKNFNLELEQTLCEQLRNHMPLRFQSILLYNTGTDANVCWTLLKPFMDRNRKERVKLGCQVMEQDGSRVSYPIRDFYKQPTPHQATQHLLLQAKQLLELRARNEAEFVL